MIMARLRATASAVALLFVAACATQRNLVVVLPESDGHVGAVVVQAGDSKALLNTGYAAAAPTRRAARPLPPGSLNDDKVKRLFGDTLAALPEPPISQNLFFDNDSLELTPESTAALRALLDSLATRKAVEVVLTGYTDTTGTADHNDALSLQRAQSIREKLAPMLAKYGISDDSITVVGRGKRDLLIETPDQTDEPRNRRVEITVR
jgi:outer membrane protein OmpA-like peptidoglycan-associated protein